MYRKTQTAVYTMMFGLLTAPAFAQERPTVEQVQKELADTAPAPADPQAMDPQQPIPPRLTIKSGTFVTVRTNEVLSSDRSAVGDAFTATLTRPIVVDGVVIASRGQNVVGRVTEVKKGHAGTTSRLGIQLIELPVVDGQQLPVQSQLLSRNSASAAGRNAVGIAATTGVGAAIGAGVNGGVGAGVGAGAGLLVGVAGVLLSRGYPAVVTPEAQLTFQVTQDVTISTERTAQAFRFVQPQDYDQPAQPAMVRRPGGPPPPPYGYGYAGGYPYYGYGYPYYPYYWGPGVGFYFGPGFYGRRWR